MRSRIVGTGIGWKYDDFKAMFSQIIENGSFGSVIKGDQAIGFPWINLILSEIRSLDGKWFAVLTRFIPNQGFRR